MIYKKDIEDLDQTMAQNSNSSITPYDGLECHKVKRSRDDCDRVEKEALMMYQTQKGLNGT